MRGFNNKSEYKSDTQPMKKQLNRRLFDQKQHQNFLLSERQLHIKQFESILSYRPTETIKLEDGSIFKGQISQDGNRNGIGMLIAPDGSVYMGKWKDGVYHEEGIYLYPDGERYEGQICQGLKGGTGKIFYLNGDIYEGEWSQDCRQGMGEIIYADGTRYLGEWKQNKPYGQGSYYNGIKLICQGIWDGKLFLSGKVVTQSYEGDWQFGGPHGKGFYKFQDGSIYDGEWKNGEKDGVGQYQYSNGDFYQGGFRCGLKQGKGFYKYATGDSYEGEFVNDYKHGYGIMKFMNGDQYKGEWSRDLFHGAGTYTFSTKDAVKATFHYGSPQNSWVVGENSPQKFSSIKNKQNMIYSPISSEKQYGRIMGSTKGQSNIKSKLNYSSGFKMSWENDGNGS